MNLLVILCAAAAVVTVEASSFRFIPDFSNRDDGNAMEMMCLPDTCIVHGGVICRCDDTGNIICPMQGTWNGIGPCICTPGEVLPSQHPCLCPSIGWITPDVCPYSFATDTRRSTGRKEQGVANKSIAGNVRGTLTSVASRRQGMTSPMEDCGYWHCEGNGHCVWVPCKRPPGGNWKN